METFLEIFEKLDTITEVKICLYLIKNKEINSLYRLSKELSITSRASLKKNILALQQKGIVEVNLLNKLTGKKVNKSTKLTSDIVYSIKFTMLNSLPCQENLHIKHDKIHKNDINMSKNIGQITDLSNNLTPNNDNMLTKLTGKKDTLLTSLTDEKTEIYQATAVKKEIPSTENIYNTNNNTNNTINTSNNNINNIYNNNNNNNNNIYKYLIDIYKYNIYNKYNKYIYNNILLYNKKISEINYNFNYDEINSFSVVNPNIYINEKGFNKIATSVVVHLYDKLATKPRKDWFMKQVGLAKQLLEKYRLDQVVAGIDFYCDIKPHKKIGMTSLLLLKNSKKMMYALDYYKSLVKKEFKVKILPPKKEMTKEEFIADFLSRAIVPKIKEDLIE